MIKTDKVIIDSVEGRCIVRNIAMGKWTPEDVQFLTDNLLELAKPFAGKKWAYVGDPTKLYPIFTKETSAAFAKLHVDLEAAGCKVIAFLDGNTAGMKLQSQKHQDSSNTNLQVLHFKNFEQASDWLKEIGI